MKAESGKLTAEIIHAPSAVGFSIARRVRAGLAHGRSTYAQRKNLFQRFSVSVFSFFP
jgi:hypothetical protein